MARTATIRELLTGDVVRLTRAEMRVARALMANYPAAGLATIATLAQRAEVSDPTVVRLVSKLGFDGFGGFQNALLREVEERMNSPLTMLDARRPDLTRGHVYGTFMGSAAHALDTATRTVLPADFDAAVELIGDPRRRVSCLGGRFSRYLAALLRAHLAQIRPGTVLIEDAPADKVDLVVNMSGIPGKGLFPKSRVLDWDVGDPYGEDLSVYREICDTIQDRLKELSAQLRAEESAKAV